MNRFDRFFENDRNIAPPPPIVQNGETNGLPDGEWLCDGVWMRTSRRSVDDPHGRVTLRGTNERPVMRAFGSDGDAIFLDLETTGLTGGTGTYAFLCALGMIDGDEFVVKQLFLARPSKEPQWLEAINDLIPRGATLVTYNGATFDIPMLQTRHILMRMTPHWIAYPHVDLLKLARKLYKGRFDSCSLGSMERNVLRIAREDDDIPGCMIPPLYAEFLRTRDASPLRGVFYHNEIDIVSLAALWCRIADVLIGDCADALELLRAGDIWDHIGACGEAERMWRASADEKCADASIRLAFMHKRREEYEAARGHFSRALDAIRAGARCEAGWCTLFDVLVEIAKIDEHRSRSYDSAMAHATSALACLKRARHLAGARYGEMLRDITRRIERIERKISKDGR